MNNNHLNIAIVGAGAAGLFLSKMLSENNRFSITLFEKSSKVGSKLKASGGGRANLFNTKILPEDYNNPAFIQTLLSDVSPEKLRQTFNRWGLHLVVDDENRVYPLSCFSQTVVDMFLHNLPRNVSIVYNCEVLKLTSIDGLWAINDDPQRFDKVILASGSPAGMIATQRENYNRYCNILKLSQKNLSPSLVGFKIEKFPKILSGCRAKAIVSLLQNNRLVFKEKGEVIFKDDGVSGIVILNVSSHYNRLANKENCSLSFNFIYDDSTFDSTDYLKKFGDYTALIHPKLNLLYKKQLFDVQDFRLKILRPYDMEFAQVCHGGIAVNEVDENFALKRYKNLYAVGEMLDIDGVCGGFNLFFAFAGAFKVANVIAYEN